MTAQTSSQQMPKSANWTKFAVRMLLLALLFPVLLFLSAGRLDWPMGWVYVVLVVSITTLSRYLMIRRNPALLEERTTALSRDDTKRWDKILAPIIAVIVPLGQIIVAGLDYRYDWSPAFAGWVEWAGIALMIAGYVFASWPMLINPYFSSTVRIQQERGQQVVTNGPYRMVRHPSYLGLLIGTAGVSLVLSSLWSLILVAVMLVAVVIRTALEDATLQRELPGYRDYAQKTRFRLFPGLW